MTTEVWPPHRLFALLEAAAFLDLLGFGIVAPVLPLAVVAAGGTADEVGLTLAGYSLAQLAAAPVLGWLADRVGRRPVVLLGLAGNAVSMAMLAVAIAAPSVLGMVVARILAGAMAGNLATLQLIIVDTTSDVERPARLGRLGAAMGIGMVAGPLVGAALSLASGWMPAVGAGVLALCSCVAAAVLLPETRPEHVERVERRVRGVLNGGVLRMLVVMLAAYFGVALLQAVMPLRLLDERGWGINKVGLGFTLFGAVLLTVQGRFLGPLTARRGPRFLVTAGALMMAAGLAAFAATVQTLVMVMALVASAAGMGVITPLVTTLVSGATSPWLRGSAMGLLQASGTLGRFLGPLVGGVMLEQWGGSTPLGAAAVMMVVAAGCAGAHSWLGIDGRGTPRALPRENHDGGHDEPGVPQ